MKKGLLSLVNTTGATVKRFWNEGYSIQASALAFLTLLSLFPLLSVMLSIISVFPVFDKVGKLFEAFIFKNFVVSSATQLQLALHQFMGHLKDLSEFGLGFLLVTAVLVVFTLEQVFNQIWHIKKQRGSVSAFLLYWAVLTLGPILIGVGLVLTGYVTAIPVVSKAIIALGIKHTFLSLAPFFTSFIVFSLLYLAVPNRRVPYLPAFIAGGVAALLFEVAKMGFGLYITRFANYQVVYGTLSAIPVFMLWIYISWLIILFGAMLSAVLGLGERVARP